MGTDLVVAKRSLFLDILLSAFRLTGIERGGHLIDLIPTRLLGGEVVWANTEAGSMALRITDTGTRELLLFGRPLHDAEETKIVCALLPSARGMLDVGANYGWYTKFAAALMPPSAPKIAVEANPHVAACLQRSLSGSPGVRVFNVAATDRARRIEFYCARGSGLSSAVRAVGTPIVVQGRPVDDIWPADQALDFVKCDVEGGELDVLRGARRIRRSHQPVWMLEFDERFLTEAGIAPSELADELSDLLCWWRSDEEGWLAAENLHATIGQRRLCQNVFLVPYERAPQFAQWIKQSVKS
jgi:FkbM family methyltransferase